MGKYIDADKLIAEIYKRREDALSVVDIDKANNLIEVIELIEDLQQEQPIRGHHTESWIEETKQELQHEEELLDMRLETLKRIRDKKNQFQQEQPLTTEKVVEQCKKFGGNPEVIYQEQPEVDLEKKMKESEQSWYNKAAEFWYKHCELNKTKDQRILILYAPTFTEFVHDIYEFGLNARKP